jgi:hypothetical protein
MMLRWSERNVSITTSTTFGLFPAGDFENTGVSTAGDFGDTGVSTAGGSEDAGLLHE